MLDVPRGTMARLEALVNMVREENQRQNLVSRASLESVWSRHILDSAQLVRYASAWAGRWLDIGSGAGFPGLVVAMLHCSKVVLVEARRSRAEFLGRAASALAIEVEIVCAKAESLAPRPFDVISARACAPLERLLALGEKFSTPATCWILPKGRSAQSELEAARASWQGDFHLEPSLTDADARIVVATQVRRKSPGKRIR